MKPARVILLIIALVTGGLAAFMVVRDDAPKTENVKTVIKQEARTKVLVASKPIGVGDRLNSDLLKWQEWPKEIVRPEFITSEMAPNAKEEFSGTVARFIFFEGEPIRQSKLAHSEQGYLSAVIEPGKRAVSIAITAESGAGGFIVPNDRVDVVLTEKTTAGEISKTILYNVKVLIINSRFGKAANENRDAENKSFEKKTIAVLELDPVQSETIVNASEVGQLALVLRSVADFGEDASIQRANSEIRLIRYGREKNVTSESGSIPSLASTSAEPQIFAPNLQELNGEFEPYGPYGSVSNALQ